MELVHALNRGVDKRNIFLDTQDYARFVHDMFEFNSTLPAGNTYRHFDPLTMRNIVSPSLLGDKKGRNADSHERLVDIHGWVLMKNHYHLLLSERVEGGLSLFLRKLNIGYAKYFNEKYERSGTLFQGRTKKVLISEQSQFLYILHYVHLNPLDYLEGSEDWRVRDHGSVLSVSTALSYLQTYRWSSYLDYCGIHNFPSILTTSLFKNEDVFNDIQKSVKDYLRDTQTELFTKLTLE